MGQPVEHGCGHLGVAEHCGIPQSLIEESLRSESLDPQHPLCGKQLAVSDRQASRSTLIVVRLPDGRERSIPRAATDLACSPDRPPPGPSRDAHISVSTLLPLANRVGIMLASLIGYRGIKRQQDRGGAARDGVQGGDKPGQWSGGGRVRRSRARRGWRGSAPRASFPGPLARQGLTNPA